MEFFSFVGRCLWEAGGLVWEWVIRADEGIVVVGIVLLCKAKLLRSGDKKEEDRMSLVEHWVKKVSVWGALALFFLFLPMNAFRLYKEERDQKDVLAQQLTSCSNRLSSVHGLEEELASLKQKLEIETRIAQSKDAEHPKIEFGAPNIDKHKVGEEVWYRCFAMFSVTNDVQPTKPIHFELRISGGRILQAEGDDEVVNKAITPDQRTMTFDLWPKINRRGNIFVELSEPAMLTVSSPSLDRQLQFEVK
jgi:hypothetical protein